MSDTPASRRRLPRRARWAALLAGGVLWVGTVLGAAAGATADAVVGTIPVGDSPVQVAVAPDGSKVYVTNSQSSSVSVIDVASDTVVGSPISVGLGPYRVAFSPDGSKAYVTNVVDDTVSVIEVATDTAVSSIAVGTLPYTAAFSPDGSKAYVTNLTDGTVSVIDVATDTVVGSPISVGPSLYTVAFAPDGSKAYVTYSPGRVAVIDAASDTVVGSPISVGLGPHEIAFSPDGSKAYVTSTTGAWVSVIDVATNAEVDQIHFPMSPYGVAFTPDGTKAYTTHNAGDYVSVIEVDVAPVITAGEAPAGSAGAPYSFTVPTTANPAPTFAVTSGALPPGLALDTATGVISGTPTTAGNYAFTVTATNALGSDDQLFTLAIMLPATGAEPLPVALVAAALLAAGFVALASRRRRPAA